MAGLVDRLALEGTLQTPSTATPVGGASSFKLPSLDLARAKKHIHDLNSNQPPIGLFQKLHHSLIRGAIIRKLDPSALLALSATCRTMYTLVDDDDLWQRLTFRRRKGYFHYQGMVFLYFYAILFLLVILLAIIFVITGIFPLFFLVNLLLFSKIPHISSSSAFFSSSSSSSFSSSSSYSNILNCVALV